MYSIYVFFTVLALKFCNCSEAMLRDLARVPDDDNFRYYFTVAPPYLDRNEESLVYNNAADAKSSAKTKRFISSTEVIFSNFQPNI